MNLLALPIAGAVTSYIGPSMIFNSQPRNLTVQANFNAGSGGTSVDCWVQTSLDGGLTWCDVANFHLTTSNARSIFNLSALTAKTTAVTPTDGTLSANTSVDGVLGPMYRTKVTSVGTYSGASLSIDLAADQGR